MTTVTGKGTTHVTCTETEKSSTLRFYFQKMVGVISLALQLWYTKHLPVWNIPAVQTMGKALSLRLKWPCLVGLTTTPTPISSQSELAVTDFSDLKAMPFPPLLSDVGMSGGPGFSRRRINKITIPGNCVVVESNGHRGSGGTEPVLRYFVHTYPRRHTFLQPFPSPICACSQRCRKSSTSVTPPNGRLSKPIPKGRFRSFP